MFKYLQPSGEYDFNNFDLISENMRSPSYQLIL